MPDEDDREYLEQIRALSFAGRSWSPAAIEQTRDFLGPWNHNIRLAPGIYTAFTEHPYPEHQTILSAIDRALCGRFDGVRVLDIGCLEGYFAVECARHGADVVGVDAKEVNVKKCEFVKSVLGVDNLSFVLEDAMNVTRERLGAVDVVLALGLLYHLDDPFTFLHNLAGVTDGLLVLDTLVALEDGPQTISGWSPELSDMQDFGSSGRRYSGRLYREYEEGADEVERAFSTTASHANDLSVWLTEESLVRLLRDAGFALLEKVVSPADAGDWWADPGEGRVLYVAHRRRRFRSAIFES
jgi:SAM-dependent methyltransferase